MIRKLRAKFVAICMALVTAVLATVLIALYIALQQNISAISDQALALAIRELPGRPALPITMEDDRVMLPYFTVNVRGTTAYVTDGTYDNLEDTELLTDIISQCLEQNQAEGTIREYQLRYLLKDNGLYRRIAFVDMSMEQAMLARMMRSYVSIALAALFLLLGISMILSHIVTKPVDKAWKQQRQFISDASHELKTPLTVILSNAELLERAELTERPARWADNIHSEAARMRSLVEEMLTLARADNAPPTVHLTEVNFSEIAMDTVLSFEPVAFEAGKGLEARIAPDLIVLGDGDKLHRLISILLDNAIKYGAEGGTVTASLEKRDRELCLTVSNPGRPIPPQELKRLFERFYRMDASRGEQSGFGLGLSIASAITAEHKGTIRAESDEESTRFIYTMHLKK